MTALEKQLLEALKLANVALSKDLSKLDRADVIGIVRAALNAAPRSVL